MIPSDIDKIKEILKDEKLIEESAEILEKIERSYSERITVQGEDKLAYFIAIYNLAKKDGVLSGTVLRFLKEIDDTEVIRELTNNELDDLAKTQGKRTTFQAEIKNMLKERKDELKKSKLQAKAEEYKRKVAAMPSYFGKTLCQDVVESIFTESLNVMPRLNLVTKNIDICGSGKDILLERYSAANIMSCLPPDILDECKACEVSGISNSLEPIKNYLFCIADRHRYNPIQEMLIEHKNDNPEQLKKIYKILNIETDFDRTLIRKWLIQCVAFAFADIDNQVSAEGVLILEGRQGLAKTSFFRTITGNPLWFCEGVTVDVSNKDSVMRVISGWICELGEIVSTFKKDQAALKALITTTIDRIRLPYAAAISNMPRSTSLCGTVNKSKFLKDDTGNRRYWIIHTENINKQLLFSWKQEDIFNMWGYIYSLYLADQKGYLLNDIERQKVELRNLDYMVDKKGEAEIRYILDFTKPVKNWEWVSPAQIAEHYNNLSAENVGNILSAIEQEEKEVVKNRTAKGVCYYIPIAWNRLPNYGGYSKSKYY